MSAAELQARLEEAKWWQQFLGYILQHAVDCSYGSHTPDGDYCDCGLSKRRKSVQEHVATLEAELAALSVAAPTGDQREELARKFEDEYRMKAYYYAFRATGVREIDTILSAVACGGKAYHHTESWQDECEPYAEIHRGNSVVEWIQNAANDAALALAPQASGQEKEKS